MSRIRKKRNTSVKDIYLHFAVITLVLTGGLAMFAEGENAQVEAEALAAQQQPEEDAITQAARGKEINEIQVRDPITLAGSFGDAAGSIRSHAYASASKVGDMVGNIPNLAQLPANVIGQLPPGMTAEEWLALNARRAQAAAAEQATEDQIEDIIAQSQLRSGKASE